jgi:hypothetical protein
MAIDTQEKRMAVTGVSRPYLRAQFPVATPDEEWRMDIGNSYGGNALDDADTGRTTTQLPLLGVG